MTRPTAAQVWRRLVDEAGEDEIEAVLSLSQEQVDAELAGAGFDLGAERAKADAFLEDLVSGQAPSPTVSATPDLVAAADWRRKAVAACDAKDFGTCVADLDIARRLDPAGEDTPLVRRTRDCATKGMLDEPLKPPLKP